MTFGALRVAGESGILLLDQARGARAVAQLRHAFLAQGPAARVRSERQAQQSGPRRAGLKMIVKGRQQVVEEVLRRPLAGIGAVRRDVTENEVAMRLAA